MYPIQKPTQEQIKQAYGKSIPDVIKKELKLLFCGINPGLYTAAIGCHFGRPGNRFWKTLFHAGFTPYEYTPDEQLKLLSLGYGITNLVNRATATANELTNAELMSGGLRLHEKVLSYKPTWLAVVGIEAYRKAFNKPKASIGQQSEKFGSTRIWVLPNPSGINAHYSVQDLTKLFKELKKTIQ